MKRGLLNPQECDTCEYRQPELSHANEDLWEFYLKVCNIVKYSGFGDFIGFDYPAIFEFARIYQFEMTPKQLAKLQFLENLRFEKARKERQSNGK